MHLPEKGRRLLEFKSDLRLSRVPLGHEIHSALHLFLRDRVDQANLLAGLRLDA
jgi:hypothetical protein